MVASRMCPDGPQDRELDRGDFIFAAVFVADEFASPLDRTTASCLATCIRKQIKAPIRFIAGSAHDDLIESLAPDVLLYTPIEGTPELLTRDSA